MRKPVTRSEQGGSLVSSQAEELRWLDLVPVLVFVVLGVLLVLALLFGIARTNRAFYRANLETISLLATLAIYLAFGAGLLAALRRLRSPLRVLMLRRPSPADIGYALLVFIPWYLGLVLVLALSALAFNGGHPIPSNSRLVFIQHPHGIGLLLLALLVTAVAAPICEEVFFRGMLLQLLSKRLPLSLAVVLSALAFGLAHASPAVSLASMPAFVYMGIVLALVYINRRNLAVSMMLHGLNNALVTIVAFSGVVR